MALTATTSFRTKSEYIERVKKLAKDTNRTAGYFYNLLLEEYLDDIEDIYRCDKIEEGLRSGKIKTIPAEKVYEELGI